MRLRTQGKVADVAVARALVLIVLTGEFIEEPELSEHGTDAAHLKHQPLNRLIAAGRIVRHELAGLFGQIDQDGARFEIVARMPFVGDFLQVNAGDSATGTAIKRALSAHANGVHNMTKTLRLMVNVLLIGIAIGRTYAAWQQRLRRRVGPT
jgi:hypothetical protein